MSRSQTANCPGVPSLKNSDGYPAVGMGVTAGCQGELIVLRHYEETVLSEKYVAAVYGHVALMAF
jgi:hypothetical protein